MAAVIEVVRGGRVVDPGEDGVIELPSQYTPWGVRRTDGRTQAPEALLDNGWAPMTWAPERELFVLPRRSESPSAGWVLLRDGTTGQALEPSIFVGASQLPRADYLAMLRDLGRLAAAASAHHVHLAEKGERPRTADDALDVQLRALERLVAALETHGDAARRSAGTAFGRQVVTRSPGDAAVDRGVALATARRPAARRVRVSRLAALERSNVEDWVDYLVAVVRREVERLEPLVDLRAARAEGAAREAEELYRDLRETYAIFRGAEWDVASAGVSPAGLQRRIEDLSRRVAHLRARQVVTTAPSESNAWRLSEGAAPLRAAFLAYLSLVPVLEIDPTPEGRLTLGLERTWRLYEWWVLWKIYVGLLERGFAPTGQADIASVFDPDAWRARGPVELADGEGVLVRLHYEPKLPILGGTHIKPDIVLDVDVHGRRRRFLLDAKYHAYGLPFVPERYRSEAEAHHGSWFLGVLLEVARNSYLRPHLDGDEEVEPTAALIVHPSQGPRFRWTGGRPIADHEDATQPSEDPRDVEWPAHRYGALRLHPDDTEDRELTTLLWLLLGYHVELRHRCWSCGQPGEELTVHSLWTDWLIPYDKRKSTGRALACSPCAQLWVDVWCRGDHGHKLVKTGRHGIHEPAPGSHTGYGVLCPACGNTPQLSGSDKS